MSEAPRPLRWLEITADYRCNNRCVGCFSVQGGGLDGGGSGEPPGEARSAGGSPDMSPGEILAALRRGRREGARWLWLGGGEPTLRRDLLATVRAARAMGYTRVKLQTNGMLLAYEDFARRCAEAGVTEAAFSIKGPDAATHDRLAQTPGCHALMVRGMEHARALGMSLEGDVLVYRSNVHALAETVRAYAPRGLGAFRLWLLSAAGNADPSVRAEVPTMTEVARNLAEAVEAGRAFSDDPGFITSLHTPPCVVPAACRGSLFRAPDLGLRVVNPGGHTFLLEESGMEGGVYLPGCARCSMRARCGGLRRDYLDAHGDAEFAPVD